MTKNNESFFYAIWCVNEQNIQLLQTAISQISDNYLVLKNMKSIFKKPKVVVFVEEELLHESFFGDNKNICEKIEDLQWFVIVIGSKKKLNPFPYMAKRIDKPLKSVSQIAPVLDKISASAQKPNSRNNVLAKKLNRLFYIYHCLYEKETITYEEVKNISNISQRTFFRDLDTLREVLLTQTITYDENEKHYTMDYIK
jgi:hypothetical protein